MVPAPIHAPDVHVGWRHDDDPRLDVGSPAHRASAGDDPHAVGDAETPRRKAALSTAPPGQPGTPIIPVDLKPARIASFTQGFADHSPSAEREAERTPPDSRASAVFASRGKAGIGEDVLHRPRVEGLQVPRRPRPPRLDSHARLFAPIPNAGSSSASLARVDSEADASGSRTASEHQPAKARAALRGRDCSRGRGRR